MPRIFSSTALETHHFSGSSKWNVHAAALLATLNPRLPLLLIQTRGSGQALLHMLSVKDETKGSSSDVSEDKEHVCVPAE